MTERDIRKLEATIKSRIAEIRERKVSVKDSGIGAMLNTLKKVDEALYEKILADYKQLLAGGNVIR